MFDAAQRILWIQVPLSAPRLEWDYRGWNVEVEVVMEEERS